MKPLGVLLIMLWHGLGALVPTFVACFFPGVLLLSFLNSKDAMAGLAGLAFAFFFVLKGSSEWWRAGAVGYAATLTVCVILTAAWNKESRISCAFAIGSVPAAVATCGYELLTRPRPRGYGFCRKCAYDLTGNQSHVCPECGTPTQIGDRK